MTNCLIKDIGRDASLLFDELKDFMEPRECEVLSSIEGWDSEGTLHAAYNACILLQMQQQMDRV